MTKIIPFFEFEGKRYEIEKNRYLMAEYDKLTKENNSLSNQDKINSVKIQSLVNDIKKYAEKVKELEDIYFDTFDENDEKKYLKVKELYEKKLEELTILEVESGSSKALQKASFDILEQVAIKGLAKKYFNDDESQANTLWCNYVETIGNDNTLEWLAYMADCLFKEEKQDEENDFLSQMRKMKEQQEINRKSQMKKK
jgi:hypothetical protein